MWTAKVNLEPDDAYYNLPGTVGYWDGLYHYPMARVNGWADPYQTSHAVLPVARLGPWGTLCIQVAMTVDLFFLMVHDEIWIDMLLRYSDGQRDQLWFCLSFWGALQVMQGRSTLGGSTKRHQVSWDIRSATHEIVEELDDELDHTYVFSHIYVFFHINYIWSFNIATQNHHFDQKLIELTGPWLP